MNLRQSHRIASLTAGAVLLTAAFTTSATDRFDAFDGAYFTAPTLVPFSGPQTHDLQSNGGVADIDWFDFSQRTARSYELRVSSPSTYATVVALHRRDAGRSIVQTGAGIWGPYSGRSTLTYLRWESGSITSDLQQRTFFTVSGSTSASANDQYDIELFDTTLFCPRYNNTGGQSSVLMLQAAPEGDNSCSFTAWFFDQAGATVGTQTGSLNESNMAVISTPAVAGVGNTRGSVRVTHTCGYRNIVGKLVSLEPATGFAFDTVCTQK